VGTGMRKIIPHGGEQIEARGGERESIPPCLIDIPIWLLVGV
jgi:hypothetical protein